MRTSIMELEKSLLAAENMEEYAALHASLDLILFRMNTNLDLLLFVISIP